jgi:carbamate kinase
MASDGSSDVDGYGDGSGPREASFANLQTVGMVLFLAALFMLFVAGLVGFVWIRLANEKKAPAGTIHLPVELWLSTVLVIGVSIALSRANTQIRLGKQRSLRNRLTAALALAIGFLILDALDKALADRGVDRRTATVVTRTRVDGDDPGFTTPTKPVGRYLPADQARALVEHGQTWEDRGDRGWRRVVASPDPLEVLDAATIKALADSGYVVVGAGGGGIPVVRDPDGTLHGVEAVIDKDLAAALLGPLVGADVLVIATDVDHVVLGYGTDAARPLERATATEMRGIAREQAFASGSMGPKVEAAVRFVENGGARAVITSLEQIEEAVHGRAGTVIEPERS